MTQQYLRQASLIVAPNDAPGTDLSTLQFAFTVKRGDIQTPNSCDVRVFNVSQQTAKRIAQGQTPNVPEYSRLVLQAGYVDDIAVIFDGTIKQVRQGRLNGTDTFLDLTAADGDNPYNYAIVNTTLAKGSKPADHVATCLKAMQATKTPGGQPSNITQGYMPPFTANALPRGKVLYGQARDTMRQVAKSNNATWSIQEGALQLVPLDSYVPGEAIQINSATGMIGVPEQTQAGIRIRTLINPALKIGRVVQLNNKDVINYRFGLSLSDTEANAFALTSSALDADGFYRILYAEHSGDTRGQEWYTDLICLGLTAPPPPSQQGKTAVAPAGIVRPYG